MQQKTTAICGCSRHVQALLDFTLRTQASVYAFYAFGPPLSLYINKIPINNMH